MSAAEENNAIIELNVGGHIYTSTTSTLIKKRPTSKLALLVTTHLRRQKTRINGAVGLDDDKLLPIIQDSQNRLFIDRDGAMFRYILDYLRWCDDSSTSGVNMGKLLATRCEKERLKLESDFYGLADLSHELEVSIAQTQLEDFKTCDDPGVSSFHKLLLYVFVL